MRITFLRTEVPRQAARDELQGVGANHWHTWPVRDAWNHNTRYHRALLSRLPIEIDRALDVGCGDGMFARLLAGRARQVVAIDVDPGEIERARSISAGVDNIHWVCADVLSYQPHEGPFDVVTALAVIHHLPFEEALTTMQHLLSPGGRLLVLGLWPGTATATDVVVSGLASITTQVLRLTRGRTCMDSPTRVPVMALREVRRCAAAALPGATVQRRLLWRYVLDWTKPR